MAEFPYPKHGVIDARGLVLAIDDVLLNGASILDFSVTPFLFGATGDGLSDDTEAIERAIEYAEEFGVWLDGQNKTFKVNSTITLSPTTRNKWRNITLDFSEAPSLTSESGATICVRKQGQAPTLVSALSTNAAYGSSSVTLTTIGDLEEEDFVLIRSTYNMTGSTASSTRAYAAQLMRIREISGTTLTFYEPLFVAYNTSETASVYKVNVNQGVDFSKVKVIGRGVNYFDRGLSISYGFQNRYDAVEAWYCQRAGVVELACFKTMVFRPWYFENVSYYVEGVSPGESGYGLSIGGCHDCHYGTIVGRRLRHAFNSNSSGSSYLHICARNITLGDIHSSEALGSPLDTHAGVGPLVFGNVFGDFSDDADTSSGLIFIQGGGGVGGSAYGNNCSLNGLMFQSYGWKEPNFEPTLSIANLMVSGRGAGEAVSNGRGIATVENRTDRDATGTSQRCIANVGSISGETDRGIRAVCSDGDVLLNVGPGVVRVRDRHAVRVISTANGKGHIRLNNTEVIFENGATFTPIIADGDDYHTAEGSEGARIEWRGGSLSSVTNFFYVDDGSIFLDGVVEPSGSQAADQIDGTGSIVRRQNTSPFLSGSGTPEGSVVANVGSIYLRTNGGTNTTLYIKESGTGNTGWVAK